MHRYSKWVSLNQSKPTNMQEQQTWLVTTGILQVRTLQKMARTQRATLGTPNNASPLASHGRNEQAQPITPETLKLSGERYKQNTGNAKGNTGNA